ncbi:MAG: STAS domain-containing protein [Acidimicrobiia bacterium]
MSENDLVQVRVTRVPVDTWKRSSAHQDAIKREFDIMMADLPTGSVPHQLTELIQGFQQRFGGYSDPTWEDMYAAAERGDREVTLVFAVPPETSAAAVELEAMLEKVDAFCREGEDLLSLATPPQLVAFRRWFLGEFVRQIDHGLPPMSWDQWQSEERASLADAEPAGRSRNGTASHAIRFEGDLDLATAGALRDEIMEARQTGAGEVTVDLSGVGFMDSVGLSLLVSAHKRLEEEGAAMKLVLPEKLRRLFEISGLTEVLAPEFVGQGPPGPAATSEGS